MFHRKSFLTFTIALATAVSAEAHINSFSYADVHYATDRVTIDLKVTQRTTLELFSLDVNHDAVLQQEELDAAWEVLYYYIDNKVKVLASGAGSKPGSHRQVKPEITDLSYFTDDYDAYVRIQLRYQLDPGHQSISIVNNLSEETDPYHRSLTHLTTKKGEFMFVSTRYNFLEIQRDGSCNGQAARKENRPGAWPDAVQKPEEIRSATGGAVIFDVSPTEEGWQRRPQAPKTEPLK